MSLFNALRIGCVAFIRAFRETKTSDFKWVFENVKDPGDTTPLVHGPTGALLSH